MPTSDKKPKPAVFAGVENKADVQLVYFTPARVALLSECNKHPVLVAQLHHLRDEEGDHSWEGMLGEIAAYCNVMTDGLYSDEDLEILYPQLTKRMTDTRLGHNAGIILTH